MNFRNKPRLALSLALVLMLLILIPAVAVALNPQPEPPVEIKGIIIVNGSPLVSDVSPVIVQDRTMVPLRAIFEALGATLEWNAADRSVIATKGSLSVWLQVGSNIAAIIGDSGRVEKSLDVAPLIYNNRTLVPLRFVSEAMGAIVQWDPATQNIAITSPSGEPSAPPKGVIGPNFMTQNIVAPIITKSLAETVHLNFHKLVLDQKLSLAEAALKQRDFLLQQPDVKQVTVLKGSNLLVQYKNDYQMVMLLGENTFGTLAVPVTGTAPLVQTGTTTLTPSTSLLKPTTPITPALVPAQPDQVYLAPSASQMPTILKPSIIPGIFQLGPPCHPKSNKALIFDCLEDDANVVSPKVSYQIWGRLAEMGYSVTNRLNNQANLANATQIDDGEYGVVFMRGHGGVMAGGDFGFLVRPWYTSPPPWNSGYTGTIPASAHNYAAGGAVQFGYIITGQFASTYWTNKAFPGTMFFLESCHGTDPGGLPGMPTWTVNHGASAWLGWNESVTFNCGDNGTKLFFDKIITQSVGDAVAAVYATGCRPPELTVHPANKGSCKLARYINDPSEAAVPDGRDFKQLKTISGFPNLYADVSFYAAPSFDEFFFYVNTDWTNKAEVLIKCHPANFEIYKETGPGVYTNKVYTGTPKISGNTYSLVIPWSTAFGTASSVQTWLYDMTGGDRLPDPPVVK